METIKVKSIIDGDTFVGEDGAHYRLIGVDAPETNQPNFKKCLFALEKIILNKELEIIRAQTKPSFGRPVIEVRLIGDSDSVNKKMNIFISYL